MAGGNDNHEERPDTALGEVLQEIEEAEQRDEDSHGGGEAADATTPNAEAQEQSQGE
ncbi:hypothetical protein [Streptomyces sp. NPDC007905]|uniref:hypothetical protein n=1 Tax=Streptomyces sp. NPDC007905 TaxID=3364788 RepID=UPI0036E68654